MAKTYSATKHLYTLNDSRESEEQLSSNESMEDEELGADYQYLQKENKKLEKKNDELNRMLADLQLNNQQLVELHQLTERRNLKHEQKQRDLIRRLSFFQVGNKQLSSQIKRLQQQAYKQLRELADAKECKKVEQGKAGELKQLLRKGQQDKDKFLNFLKNLLQMLKKCNRPQEYHHQQQKIISFVARNIQNAESQNKINCEFDFKFELSRIDTLKEKIKSLQSQLEETKQLLEKQRSDRKKMVSNYNEKISKLRELYDGLKERVELQEQQSRRKIKSILYQKNEVIQNLKSKLKESRTRKNSLQMKKSRENRKSFIGDGDYSHLELTQLNEAIENLEMQIIKEFEE